MSVAPTKPLIDFYSTENQDDLTQHTIAFSKKFNAMAVGGLDEAPSSDSNTGKDKDRDIRHLYIATQISQIQRDIYILEGQLEDYRAQRSALGLQIESNTATIGAFETVMDTIDEQNPNATYGDFLKSKYGDKVFTAQDGNALEAIQNPLRDEQGQAVYSDVNGNLYHLQTDENGAPVTNPETQAPERVYYTDADQISGLMEKAFDDTAPKPFAEWTSKSQDPTNYRMREIVDIPTKEQEESFDHSLSADDNPAQPNPDKLFSVSPLYERGSGPTLGKFRAVCDAHQCQKIDENIELELERDDLEDTIATTEEKLESKYQDLETLQKQERITGTFTTASDRGTTENTADQEAETGDKEIGELSAEYDFELDKLGQEIDNLGPSITTAQLEELLEKHPDRAHAIENHLAKHDIEVLESKRAEHVPLTAGEYIPSAMKIAFDPAAAKEATVSLPKPEIDLEYERNFSIGLHQSA